MKFSEIKTKPVKELEHMLVEEKQKCLALRIALRASGDCKPSDIRKSRKNIARIKTYLNSLD